MHMSQNTKTEIAEAPKELKPGQVKGPYRQANDWYYETLEFGKSCGFGTKEGAETNIEAYLTWVKNRK